MELIGKTTLHPAVFFSGKGAGYAVWLLFVLDCTGWVHAGCRPASMPGILGVVCALVGILLVAVSLINLGSSTRLGLPAGKTTFRQGGVYRFSRNPMYVGFHLITVGSVLWLACLWTVLAAVYSLVVYHLIILGEERFLEGRFGKPYTEYATRVRRYLGVARRS